jgi:mutator protein MutT
VTVVLAGVIERGGWILLTQRRHGGSHGGLWEFPGGKREPGEGDVAGLAREIREELHLEVRVGRRLWTERAGPLELRFYACAYPPAARPRPTAAEQLRWVRREDLVRYAFPPADTAFVTWLAHRGSDHGGPKRG